jgi:hypothetical protein
MKKSQKKAVAVGAGVAALAAAAAGAYFFTGKRGVKNRKKVSTWTANAKRDVMKEMGKMKKVSKDTYNKTVDTVLANYKNVKNIDKKELATVTNELKGHWNAIAGEVEKARKQVARVLPKVKKTVAKKSKAKKAPAKKKTVKKAAKKRR